LNRRALVLTEGIAFGFLILQLEERLPCPVFVAGNRLNMKKLFFVCLLSISGFTAFCQNVPNYDMVLLGKPSDFREAERTVLVAANYLLSTPLDGDAVDRLRSIQFISKWMGATPDYRFSLDGPTNVLGEGDLHGLYLAALCKYSLENPSQIKDSEKVKVNSWKLVLAYCDNPSHKVKMNKKLKKLSEANKRGELEKKL
jgi:hypothetical protein